MYFGTAAVGRHVVVMRRRLRRVVSTDDDTETGIRAKVEIAALSAHAQT